MGEASHPGPVFTIVSENVPSYLAHSAYLGGQLADVQAMQEARLTVDGQAIADAEMMKHGKKWVHGIPQPIRSGTLMSTTDARPGWGQYYGAGSTPCLSHT